MSFKDLKITSSLEKAVDELGFLNPTLIQKLCIPVILNCKDVIASAQTGTGKTAAFAIPIIQLLTSEEINAKRKKNIKSLIVTPTRELASQIGKTFNALEKFTNIKTVVIYGGTEIEPQIKLLESGPDILVATPGRLLDLHKQDLVNLDHVEIFVLDEADLMLDLGFQDDIKKIERLCTNKSQNLLFSATIPYKVEQLAKSILKDAERIDVNPSEELLVSQKLYYVPKRYKISLCLHLLQLDLNGRILIFRRTKFGVDKLYERLTNEGFKVNYIHGNRSQSERQNALADFKRGRIDILIATDVAARGLDIPELDVVVNFDMPNVAETYVHRIGRTGRAGNFGEAISLCSADEKNYIKQIEEFTKIQIPVVENHPHPLDKNAKAEIHRKKGSKHKKNRKGSGSKRKKRRWY